MFYLSEDVAQQVVTMADAIDTIETCFLRLASGTAEAFAPAVGHSGSTDRRFGAKLGSFTPSGPLGVKVGSYWPGNRDTAMSNHGSTTLLLDPATGHPSALVRATWLNAMRTAAADAVAVQHLARRDASTLGVVGAGHQALFDIMAVCTVRPIERVMIWARDRARAEDLAARASARTGLSVTEAALEATCECDVVVSVTAATSAVIAAPLIRPGTHVSAMGSDGRGKIELDPALLPTARLFADLVGQSFTIGEFQTAFAAGLIDAGSVAPLGAVIAGTAAGRVDAADITIFDSSGIGLQDIAIAQLALRRALDAGLVMTLP